MLKKQKQDLLKQLQSLLLENETALLINHKAITFSQIDKIKRQANDEVIIKKIKNRIAKQLFEKEPYNNLKENLTNENIIIFSNDLFKACEVANFFEKSVKNIKIIKSCDKNDEFNQAEIKKLALMKSKKGLQSNVVSVINNITGSVVNIIDAVRKNKEESA